MSREDDRRLEAQRDAARLDQRRLDAQREHNRLEFNRIERVRLDRQRDDDQYEEERRKDERRRHQRNSAGQLHMSMPTSGDSPGAAPGTASGSSPRREMSDYDKGAALAKGPLGWLIVGAIFAGVFALVKRAGSTDAPRPPDDPAA